MHMENNKNIKDKKSKRISSKYLYKGDFSITLKLKMLVNKIRHKVKDYSTIWKHLFSTHITEKILISVLCE